MKKFIIAAVLLVFMVGCSDSITNTYVVGPEEDEAPFTGRITAEYPFTGTVYSDMCLVKQHGKTIMYLPGG